MVRTGEDVAREQRALDGLPGNPPRRFWPGTQKGLNSSKAGEAELRLDLALVITGDVQRVPLANSLRPLPAPFRPGFGARGAASTAFLCGVDTASSG